MLGCLLLDPNEGLQYCLEHLRTPRQLDRPKTESGRYGTLRDSSTTFFYELKHQVIFEAMLEMNEARQGIDLITLNDRGELQNLDVVIRPMNALAALKDIITPQMVAFLSGNAG